MSNLNICHGPRRLTFIYLSTTQFSYKIHISILLIRSKQVIYLTKLSATRGKLFGAHLLFKILLFSVTGTNGE
jgi:hypothetical protein